MTERRQPNNTEPVNATNGGGEITASSPLPARLREQERRVAIALTGEMSASDLADLLQQTDWAVIAAKQYAKAEQEAALDPTQSPDLHIARQRAEDALFLVGRLKTLQPRLLAHYRLACEQEAIQDYVAKRDGLRLERDALASELQATYPEATGTLVDLFARIKDFQRRVQQTLSDPPSGCDPLKVIDGVQVLDAVALPDLADPQRPLWPPPSTFAATFAQSMIVPLHPGPAWCDPEYQERRRAELKATQERTAAYHVQAVKAEEDRINKELKERFLARQRA